MITVKTAPNSHVGIIALEHSGSLSSNSAKSFLITNALKEALTCESIQETSSGDADASLSSDEAISNLNADSSTPNVWILRSFRVGTEGHHTISETIPNTKSSYIISGFSDNLDRGISRAEVKRIETVKEFFVEIHAPGRATIGEVLKIEIFVFNFIKNTLDPKVSITISNDDASFEFADPATDGKETNFALSGEKVKSFVTSVNGVEKVSCFIRPVKQGFFKLRVSASTSTKLTRSADKNIYVEDTRLKTGVEKLKKFNSKQRKVDGTFFNIEEPPSFVEGSIQNDVQVVCNPEGFDDFNLSIDFTYTLLETETEIVKTLHFDSSNASISQMFDIPRVTGLSLNSAGPGSANVRFVQSYLEKPVSLEERFSVELNPSGVGLHACISLKSGTTEQNVVAEVFLPSGFEFDESARPALMTKGVENIELLRENTVVNLLFRSITTDKTCVDIKAKQKFYVWTKTFNSVRVYEKGKEGWFAYSFF